MGYVRDTFRLPVPQFYGVKPVIFVLTNSGESGFLPSCPIHHVDVWLAVPRSAAMKDFPRSRVTKDSHHFEFHRFRLVWSSGNGRPTSGHKADNEAQGAHSARRAREVTTGRRYT